MALLLTGSKNTASGHWLFGLMRLVKLSHTEAMHVRRVHIFGASGSGTSTLGRSLAESMGAEWHDADDTYWMPTEQPFTVKRPIPDRHSLLLPQLAKAESWVLSGSMVSWCDPFLPLIEAGIYLWCPPDLRMKRLWERERSRYGSRVDPGGDREHLTKDFLAWAQGYDSGEFPGRSAIRHQEWIKTLPFPVLQLDSSSSRNELLVSALSWMEELT